MPEKGVCLARCTGELHPAPSGRVYVYSEVLELLLSGERNSGSFMPSGVLFGTFVLSSFIYMIEKNGNLMEIMIE